MMNAVSKLLSIRDSWRSTRAKPSMLAEELLAVRVELAKRPGRAREAPGSSWRSARPGLVRAQSLRDCAASETGNAPSGGRGLIETRREQVHRPSCCPGRPASGVAGSPTSPPDRRGRLPGSRCMGKAPDLVRGAGSGVGGQCPNHRLLRKIRIESCAFVAPAIARKSCPPDRQGVRPGYADPVTNCPSTTLPPTCCTFLRVAHHAINASVKRCADHDAACAPSRRSPPPTTRHAGDSEGAYTQYKAPTI